MITDDDLVVKSRPKGAKGRRLYAHDPRLKIIDLSAGNRAVWFDKNHRDAVYVDIRPEVSPTFVADARALPAEVGTGYDLVVFDPPHKNNGASGKMTQNYGHWTAEQITEILTGTAREAHRITKPNGLMALKWNDHSRRLETVLALISQWWEPLFGHGAEPQQRGRSKTYWVMLRRRDTSQPFSLNAYDEAPTDPAHGGKIWNNE